MNNLKAPLAHITEDKGLHNLDDHLKHTATLAAKFAFEFGASEWEYIYGLWHDPGKQ